MTHAMEALYNNDECFHNRLKVSDSMTAVLAKTAFNDIKHWKPEYRNTMKNIEFWQKYLQYAWMLSENMWDFLIHVAEHFKTFFQH